MALRKLTVTSCNVKFEGTAKTGKPFTIYEVGVRGEDGEPIMEEFKSFDSLPIGELIEYEVEKEDHPKYGVSYLLKLPKGMAAARRPNLQGEIAELRGRVDTLERQVASLAGTATPAAIAGTGSDREIAF